VTEYSAQVTEYHVLDDVAEERHWRGTITTDEVTFSFVRKDDGLTGETGFTQPHFNRLLLYTPDGRRVTWSENKGAEKVRGAVESAICKATALYRPVLTANDDAVSCQLTIKAASVVYEDKYGKTSYPRREDGSVDVDGGKEA